MSFLSIACASCCFCCCCCWLTTRTGWSSARPGCFTLQSDALSTQHRQEPKTSPHSRSKNNSQRPPAKTHPLYFELGVSILSLCSWSDVKQWVIHTLVPHLHQNPLLSLVGSPRLQYTQALRPAERVFLGDPLVTRQLTLAELSVPDYSMKLCVNVSSMILHHIWIL